MSVAFYYEGIGLTPPGHDTSQQVHPLCEVVLNGLDEDILYFVINKHRMKEAIKQSMLKNGN